MSPESGDAVLRVTPTTREDVVANPLAEQWGETLLEKISRDRYPSTTQMDMLEAIATPRAGAVHPPPDREAREDEYPSIPMMQRAQRLIAGFGR
jgi:hypothetical protein